MRAVLLHPVAKLTVLGGRLLGVAILALAALTAAASPGSFALADDAGATAPSARPDYREPVVLASKDGVLEVRLTARQGRASLDTVADPVEDFLLFGYEVIRGTASDGKMSGRDLYPAPTLNVFPGERLIVHIENGLSDLTIGDYFSPRYTAKGGTVPIYPEQMTSSPFNLHVHGIHVSPKGNADNVLIFIPPGLSNTYTYDIPKSMPHGAYWYHSHLHTLTTAQVYTGLVGLLAIGRLDGNLPAVTENQIPIRNMVLQYNFVFDRDGGLAKLNNPNWPQYVSTFTPPKAGELETGTYRPLLAPVNFNESKPGETYSTVWYTGPLSINNNRGTFQFVPSNLQRFTAHGGMAERDVPENPALPDEKRDVQFTVNGQFQPVVKSKAGQTEIWVLSNVSDFAYMSVQLTETATGRHPKIAIVGQDGNPYAAVHHPPFSDGTRIVISPASRYAIAVTIPAEGELVLEMPPLGGGARTITAPGVLYTNDGTENPPAILGSLSVKPSAVSYADGFFVFPTQVLARAVPAEGGGKTVPFVEGQPLGGYTSFAELSGATPDVKRRIVIGGGFLNNLASNADPKAFVYSFDGAAFPNMPLIQPRLNSVEEWTFVNNNNDEHPIHVHVNDFQVTEYFDPTTGLRTGPDMFGVDNANVPAPTMQIDESVVQPGLLSMRTRFEDYIGLFVMHCHRLNHEDNGLMALVNVIPAVSTYAVAVPGAPGEPAEVRVYDGAGDRLVATLVPFPGFEGAVSAAMGDIDDDGVLDLVVGAGTGHAPEVVAYAGKAKDGKPAFSAELVRFLAFPPGATGGVHVAAAEIDGKPGDNIVVGSGPGVPSEVKVFGAPLRGVPGIAPAPFAAFAPYPGDASGVEVATGVVDFATGRNSIVTAPGAGRPTEVKVFVFSLLTPIAGGDDPEPAGAGEPDPDQTICRGAGQRAGGAVRPLMTASFAPFGDGYRGGVSLATGWLAGSLGGAERIVVGRLDGPGTVKVFSSGSALDGGPAMYLHDPSKHDHGADFREVAHFEPFAGATGGTHVATTSTVYGADLLVSGVGADGPRVVKYELVRPGAEATTLEAVRLGEVASLAGPRPAMLGGD